MPNDREQVADPQDTSTVDVQAHEVNTFAPPVVQPPPENDRAKAIAEGLSRFIPSLLRFGTATMDTMSEKDMAQGQAARVKSQQDWAGAVRSGAIPPGASPWFRMGYDQMDMHLQGQQYDAALQAAYASSSARHSNKPDDLASFQQSFQKSWLQQNPNIQSNPMFGKVWAPLAAQAANQLQQTHARDIINDTEDKAEDSLGQLVTGQVATRMLHPNEDTIHANIQGFIDHAYAMGMPGRQANEIAAKAIRDQAVLEGDASIIRPYISQLRTSNGGSVAGTAWGKELIHEGELQIYTEQYRKAELDRMQTQAKRDEVSRVINSNYLNDLIQNGPGADPTTYIQQAAQAGIPEAAEKLLQARRTIGMIHQDDPKAISGMLESIYSGQATPESIMDFVNQGLASKETVGELWGRFQESTKHKALLNDPQITSMRSDLGKEILGGDETFQKFDPNLVQRTAEAKNAFMSGMVDWEEKNPKGLYKDKLQYAQDLQRFLVKRVTDASPIAREMQGSSPDKGQVESAQSLDKAFDESRQPPAPPKPTPAPAPTPAKPSKPMFATTDQAKTLYDLINSDPAAKQRFMNDHNLTSDDDIADFFKAQKKLLSAAAKGGSK